MKRFAMVVALVLASGLITTPAGAATVPVLAITPTVGVAGNVIVAAGSGFPVSSKGQMWFNASSIGMPTFTTDAAGAFRTTFVVPTRVAAGSNRVAAWVGSPTSGDTTHHAYAYLTLGTPAPSPSSSPSPSPSPSRSPSPSASPSPSPSPSPSAPPSASPSPGSDPILMGAGDICVTYNLAMAQATERLLAAVPGANIFTAGDNSNESGSTSQYANCIGQSWGLLKSQTRPVPGNHDYGSSGAAPYFAYYGAQAGTPGKGYYSYDLSGWHVIALNSECDKVGGCGAGSAQEAWLKADLAAHPATCTIAYWHRPEFSSGSSGGSTAYRAFWDDLYAAGAEIVINGHDHDYERFAPQTPAGAADPAGGIREFVVGTGGSFFTGVGSAHANSQIRQASAFGVLKLTLRPGRYDFQFVPVPGSTFTDAGTGTCH